MMIRILTLMVVVALSIAGSWAILLLKDQEPAQADTQPAANTTEHWRTSGDFVVAFGEIDVAEGTRKLSFPLPGRIESVHVVAGTHVSAGAILLELDATAAKAELARSEAVLAEAQTQLEQALSNIKPHELQIKQQEQLLKAAQSATEVEMTQLHRLKSVGDRTGASGTNIDIQEQRVISQQAMVAIEKLKLEQLREEDPQNAVKLAEAAVALAQAGRSLAVEAHDNHRLLAPANGLVLRVDTGPGEVVTPTTGKPLIWFVSDAPRIIRCEVNDRYARRVQVGMPVWYYEDRTEELLGQGTIVRRAAWIAEQRDVVQRPFQPVDQRTLECLIELESTPPDLWLGERVRVVIETVPLKKTESESIVVAPASSQSP